MKLYALTGIFHVGSTDKSGWKKLTGTKNLVPNSRRRFQLDFKLSCLHLFQPPFQNVFQVLQVRSRGA